MKLKEKCYKDDYTTHAHIVTQLNNNVAGKQRAKVRM